MSKRATYILSKHVKTPFVVDSNLPHQKRQIKFKEYKAGDMVTGIMHMKGDKPDFLLVDRRFVIPAIALKEVVTQELHSNANGSKDVEKYIKTGNPKVKYLDAAIVGGIIGFTAIIIAEKKEWISMPSKQNKILGAAIGATLLAYAVYRIRNKKNKN